MRTVVGLFEHVVSPENLWGAYLEARRRKTRRADVAQFALSAETSLCDLRSALVSDRWRPAGYRSILIREPKRRLIAAASFADRVVHHAVHRQLAPVLLRRHMPDSFACLEGRGTHRAVLAFQEGLRRHPGLIRIDACRYFLEIGWDGVLEIVARSVRDARFLGLVERILESGRGLYDDSEVLGFLGLRDAYLPGARKGLPIGNLTSQLFAHVYLDGVDHFIKRDLKVPKYVRYMDDLVLFGSTPGRLRSWAAQVRAWLWVHRRLPTRVAGTQAQKTRGWHRFLGYTVSREARRVSSPTVRRLRGRLKAVLRAGPEEVDGSDIEERLRATVKGLVF